MTEAELLAHVLDAAAELGVLVHHSGDARADAGDPGFPDLVLVGRSDCARCPAALELWELKSSIGTMDRRQAHWADRLMGAGVTHRLVRPESWPGEIRDWLCQLQKIPSGR